jgi:hypothetical protein
MKQINSISAMVGGLAIVATLLSGGIWLIKSAEDQKNGTTKAEFWKHSTYVLGGITLISIAGFAITKEKGKK